VDEVMAKEQFSLLTTNSVGKAVVRIQEAFRKKKELAKQCARLIKQFEEDTGLMIDIIKYQRDITLPSRGSMYTDLTIVITPEEFREENGDSKDTNNDNKSH
jgi:hypothetical protein